MAVGVGIGFLFPQAVASFNQAVSVGTTNIPIAIGPILMFVLASVFLRGYPEYMTGWAFPSSLAF